MILAANLILVDFGNFNRDPCIGFLQLVDARDSTILLLTNAHHLLSVRGKHKHLHDIA
jgi:hypothetical protein